MSCKRKVLPPRISTLAQKTSIYCSYPTGAHLPKVTPCTFLLNTSRCLLSLLLPFSLLLLLLSFLPSSILCTVILLSILASIHPPSSLSIHRHLCLEPFLYLLREYLISVRVIAISIQSHPHLDLEQSSSLFGAILTPSFVFYFGGLITASTHPPYISVVGIVSNMEAFTKAGNVDHDLVSLLRLPTVAYCCLLLPVANHY